MRLRRWKGMHGGASPSGKVGPGRRSAAALLFAKSRRSGNSTVCRLARCDSGVERGCTGRPLGQNWPRPVQRGRAFFRQIASERKFHSLPSCAMRLRRWKRMNGGASPSGKVGPGRCSTAAVPFVKSRWNGNSPVCRLARCDSCSGRGCTRRIPLRQSWPRPAQRGRASFRQMALERRFPADIIRLSLKAVRRKVAQSSGAQLQECGKKFAIIGDMPSKRCFPWQKGQFCKEPKPFCRRRFPKSSFAAF